MRYNPFLAPGWFRTPKMQRFSPEEKKRQSTHIQ